MKRRKRRKSKEEKKFFVGFKRGLRLNNRDTPR